jgi:hypothetical protein
MVFTLFLHLLIMRFEEASHVGKENDSMIAESG